MIRAPKIEPFFDEATNTFSYLVFDDETREAAVIDTVLDFDLPSARVSSVGIDRIEARIKKLDLNLRWIMETHVHADHLSGAVQLRKRLGGQIVIGEHVDTVCKSLLPLFGKKPQDIPFIFDRLVGDGDTFEIGNYEFQVMHTPGHTPACVSYKIGNAIFVGDTIFAPSFGSGRCDFPGGDARTLYQTIQRFLTLPDETRLFLCHDYPEDGRAPECETSIGALRRENIHMREGITQNEFVTMRTERDKNLKVPYLFIPSLQVNMGAALSDELENQILILPVNKF